ATRSSVKATIRSTSIRCRYQATRSASTRCYTASPTKALRRRPSTCGRLVRAARPGRAAHAGHLGLTNPRLGVSLVAESRPEQFRGGVSCLADIRSVRGIERREPRRIERLTRSLQPTVALTGRRDGDAADVVTGVLRNRCRNRGQPDPAARDPELVADDLP